MKTVCMVVVALLSYVGMDILIWQRIFEAKGLVDAGVGQYHLGWQVALLGLLGVGSIALASWHQILVYAFALYALAHSGLEDILYYWLDGRAIPATLPWLDQAPMILFKPVTNSNLLASAVIWIAVVILLGTLITNCVNTIHNPDTRREKASPIHSIGLLTNPQMDGRRKRPR